MRAIDALRHDHFLKLPKAERQARERLLQRLLEAKVKILTQRILSGETSAPSGAALPTDSSCPEKALEPSGDEEASPGQQRRMSIGFYRPFR